MSQEFLDSIPNKQTKKQYKWGLENFSKWFGKSPDEILEMRRDDLTPKPNENPIDFRKRRKRFERELEKFHSFALESGRSINSAKTLTSGLKQLFRYNEMPLVIRYKSPVNNVEVSNRSFHLDIEHVRKMFEFANMPQKVYLSLATDLGLRISDFVNLKINSLPDLNKEPPLPLELRTLKKRIIARGFISAESVDLLKKYLPTLENRKFVFPSNGGHISTDAVNRWLKELSKKARIDTNGKTLSHHCFRKMFLSASIDSGIGLTAGKMMCGKSVPPSDNTYLVQVKLRQHFTQLKKMIRIHPIQVNNNHEKMEALEKAMDSLQKENLDFRIRQEELQTTVQELQEEKTLREKNNDLFTELLEKQLRNVAEAKKDIDFLKQKIFSLEEEEPKPKDNLFS